ncbi:MAG: hypothetical protein JXR49_04575, partial [Acidobacteria bacterium]|nr:hypothetical protein [Acidobacteriota bacterium]
MKTKSSRREFLQSGLAMPAAGFILSPLSLKAASPQPGGPVVGRGKMTEFKPEYIITEMKK